MELVKRPRGELEQSIAQNGMLNGEQKEASLMDTASVAKLVRRPSSWETNAQMKTRML